MMAFVHVLPAGLAAAGAELMKAKPVRALTQRWRETAPCPASWPSAAPCIMTKATSAARPTRSSGSCTCSNSHQPSAIGRDHPDAVQGIPQAIRLEQPRTRQFLPELTISGVVLRMGRAGLHGSSCGGGTVYLRPSGAPVPINPAY